MVALHRLPCIRAAQTLLRRDGCNRQGHGNRPDLPDRTTKPTPLSHQTHPQDARIDPPYPDEYHTEIGVMGHQGGGGGGKLHM